MKKVACVFAMLIVLVTFTVFAQISDVLGETTTVAFTNNTGYEIYNIFFSPGDSEYWGPDLLDSTTVLAVGQTVEFLVHHPATCNDFDFMAIDQDNDAYFLWNQTICDTRDNAVTLTLDAYSGEKAPGFELVEIAFVNTTSYDMWLLFISPSDSSYIGVDYLGSDGILSQNESVAMYIPAGKTQIPYDIIAFDQDGDRYQFQIGVDSSQSARRWPIEMSDLQ